jgi:hypothetical protein
MEFMINRFLYEQEREKMGKGTKTERFLIVLLLVLATIAGVDVVPVNAQESDRSAEFSKELKKLYEDYGTPDEKVQEMYQTGKVVMQSYKIMYSVSPTKIAASIFGMTPDSSSYDEWTTVYTVSREGWPEPEELERFSKEMDKMVEALSCITTFTNWLTVPKKASSMLHDKFYLRMVSDIAYTIIPECISVELAIDLACSPEDSGVEYIGTHIAGLF